ncbi:hypothetical protein DFQ27_000466 [Actinomortierella ambigua]|uniref:Uncharacterized protein n=1 Tax=Actinomortierella ambigua TaxID=1343610 RepID=A0A9P6PMH5_9FUNG|nr:hypothetical protein DFQ27_000466 [Actinomortierella ambigua]
MPNDAFDRLLALRVDHRTYSGLAADIVDGEEEFEISWRETLASRAVQRNVVVESVESRPVAVREFDAIMEMLEPDLELFHLADQARDD